MAISPTPKGCHAATSAGFAHPSQTPENPHLHRAGRDLTGSSWNHNP